MRLSGFHYTFITGTMSIVVQDSTSLQPVEEIIQGEVTKAREAYKPISRRMIALALAEKRKIQMKEAMDLVDEYCDEHEPAIPGYISSEFGIYYLKVVAIANVGIGIFLCYLGVQAFKNPRAPGLPSYAWFVLGTLFVGFAALCWVKSVERALGGPKDAA